MDLVTLPTREGTQLTTYNSEDITMVREHRLLTVNEGVNRIQFSWAAAMAKDLGSEIAEPRRIEEDLSVNEAWHAVASNFSNSVATEGDRGAEQETLAPAMIPIRIRVKVTFRLVTHGG